jgi:hypothetical protein
MKYQIGEQIHVKGSSVSEIISEVETIHGVNIYYTFNGNSYNEESLCRHYIQNKVDVDDKASHISEKVFSSFLSEKIVFNCIPKSAIMSYMESLTPKKRKKLWGIF